MSICNPIEIGKPYPSLNESELKSALEPDIKVLRIREYDLDNGTSFHYAFNDRDDAIDYIFDINLRKNIPIPIGFNRYPYMIEMTLVSSSEITGRVDLMTMMAEMIFDNWVDSTKLNLKH